MKISNRFGRFKDTNMDNNGFSLVEILVSIAIVGMITVTLLNSFVFSKKVLENNKKKQDAVSVATSLIENIKAADIVDGDTIDLSIIETMLKGVGATAISVSDDKLNYSFRINASNDSNFDVSVTLKPKNDYAYADTKFMDVYNDASVIYSELVLSDYSILSAIENCQIDYSNINNPSGLLNITIFGSDGIGKPYTPSSDDMMIRQTYGNLFADEYRDVILSLPVLAADYIPMNDKFKKNIIDKVVNVIISEDEDRFIVNIYPQYYMEYDVFCKGVIQSGEASEEFSYENAIVRYKGLASYPKTGATQDELIKYEVRCDKKQPIYLLYSKTIDSKVPGPLTPEFNENFFKSVKINIECDESVHSSLDLYVVEQQGNEDSKLLPSSIYSIEVKNKSTSLVNLYSADSIAVSENIKTFFASDEKNVGYTKDTSDMLLELYDIKVDVISKGKNIYSVTGN